MSKTVRISDELYRRVEEYATKEMRSIPNALEYLVGLGTTPAVLEQPNKSSLAGDLLREKKQLQITLNNLISLTQREAVERQWTDEEAKEWSQKKESAILRRLSEIDKELKEIL